MSVDRLQVELLGETETYDVTWVASFLAQDGSRCICVYDAPSADAVRRVYRPAGVPFDAVWPANHYTR